MYLANLVINPECHKYFPIKIKNNSQNNIKKTASWAKGSAILGRNKVFKDLKDFKDLKV